MQTFIRIRSKYETIFHLDLNTLIKFWEKLAKFPKILLFFLHYVSRKIATFVSSFHWNLATASL